MNRAMLSAATGMAEEQAHLDNVADNLSNADVVGFKAAQLHVSQLSDGRHNMGAAASGLDVGLKQGKLYKSGGSFDMAIDGNGFFAVQRPNGTTVYTRDGQFERALDGSLKNRDGLVLVGVKIPENALKADVSPDGKIFIDTATKQHVPAGQMHLVTFSAAEKLRPIGNATFAPTKASGAPHTSEPGDGVAGKISFGMLERSNVSIMESMMEILSAQRAFEANSKGVQAADEMQRIANNLNKS